eukprot:TRINITY_DN37814_c0_g1_i5.p1 TRINITY_DN37814_c0_g1~~TRINITY_DN37814_c0_g1_i5.p1  ORF type:complete len:316 (+),score=70.63 TRINITY_DN37814_c0_g1_i5:77-1024(+)
MFASRWLLAASLLGVTGCVRQQDGEDGPAEAAGSVSNVSSSVAKPGQPDGGSAPPPGPRGNSTQKAASPAPDKGVDPKSLAAKGEASLAKASSAQPKQQGGGESQKAGVGVAGDGVAVPPKGNNANNSSKPGLPEPPTGSPPPKGQAPADAATGGAQQGPLPSSATGSEVKPGQLPQDFGDELQKGVPGSPYKHAAASFQLAMKAGFDAAAAFAKEQKDKTESDAHDAVWAEFFPVPTGGRQGNDVKSWAKQQVQYFGADHLAVNWDPAAVRAKAKRAQPGKGPGVQNVGAAKHARGGSSVQRCKCRYQATTTRS